jgi:hypothetical protein
MSYIYTKKYYSVIKSYIIKLAGKWIELKKIIPSKVIETQKDKNAMCSHIVDLVIKCRITVLTNTDP